jgi:hypothetical protein
LAALAILLICASAHAAERPATLLAAGDIALCGSAGARRTAALLDRLPGAIIVLGDLAYKRGTAAEFRDCYGPAWGRHKARSYPAPGNHEYYGTPTAEGYFGYWGRRAGPAGRGYYSFDLGAWHIVSLNSSVDAEPGSAQDLWLREDLAATAARCVLAYWHHPVFSSGKHGNIPRMLPLYRRLYAAGATLVLAGHDHLYERFAPQDPDGRADPARGIRSFTVGTGGRVLYDFKTTRPNSEARHNRDWGVLSLTLHAGRYAWAFITVDGERLDSGAADCVERP